MMIDTTTDIPDALRLAACKGAINTILDMMKVTGKTRFEDGDAHFVLLAIPFAETAHGGAIVDHMAFVQPRIRAELARDDLNAILAEIRNAKLPPAHESDLDNLTFGGVLMRAPPPQHDTANDGRRTEGSA